MAMDAREAREVREAREAREIRETREAREIREERERRTERAAQPSTAYAVEMPPSPPPGYSANTTPRGTVQDNQVMVYPGLPDPNSGRLFQLQVGAYNSPEGATQAFQLLRIAGFDAVQEQTGDVFRVYADGVPAVTVQFAAQRLGVMGFRQVWIRE
jgi:cell division septation protein DedD